MSKNLLKILEQKLVKIVMLEVFHLLIKENQHQKETIHQGSVVQHQRDNHHLVNPKWEEQQELEEISIMTTMLFQQMIQMLLEVPVKNLLKH